MFLHVGNNKNIRKKDIIGIFDSDSSTVSKITKQYLSHAQKNNAVVSANYEIPKSFVLYKESGKYMVCFSQLSSGALIHRMHNL